MSGLIQTYYEHAQLSDAAYAILATGMSRGDYQDALVQRGFTIAEAAAFAATYSIVETYPDDETSFFAVLFSKTGTNEKILAIRGTSDFYDLAISDAQLALLGVTSQDVALKSFYPDILRN